MDSLARWMPAGFNASLTLSAHSLRKTFQVRYPMANHSVPNEITCPVPVDLLALLLRSDETRTAEIVRALPPTQRAALAAFCYLRSHMRTLGFKIAKECDVRSLRLAAGAAAELLIEHSRSDLFFEPAPSRQSISPARLAA